jgi:hypothetical protein
VQALFDPLVIDLSTVNDVRRRPDTPIWKLHAHGIIPHDNPDSRIFQGRDAIRRGFRDALKIGLHDYSVRRVISRSEGSFVFNVGEWQAEVGDQPFRGYYTAILVRERDQTKIMEETVTVAAP